MTTIDGRKEENYKRCYCKEELGGQMVYTVTMMMVAIVHMGNGSI